MADSTDTLTAMALSTSKAVMGNEIITQTLDAMNSPMYGSGKSCGDNGMSDTYNLNKQVLSAAYSDKSALVNSSS